jgi:CheY-like chemotaxis protein
MQMDLQMPVMDGVEAVACIRAHEAAHALPPSLVYMGAARRVPGARTPADARRPRSLRPELRHGQAPRDRGRRGWLLRQAAQPAHA